jgi:hypothetical protein
MVVFLFNTVIYVFLLLCLCILIVCLRISIVPTGTLRLPWLRFFRAFSSVVRQLPGYKSQRRGTARTLPIIFVLFYVLFVLCRSVYCLCVNVYCTAASGWQPNCSLTNISIYHIINRIFQFVPTSLTRTTQQHPPPPLSASITWSTSASTSEERKHQVVSNTSGKHQLWALRTRIWQLRADRDDAATAVQTAVSRKEPSGQAGRTEHVCSWSR